ncbi:MAG: GNAT family N-acetyltransferase [Desulfobulbaceae bacterium]|nr:GNAT family N-acetyltransferase [Candidatus Kapabacteria bacterium]MBS4000723.1 GNAT family N-acetyltransferase [Desulfobulbaceae bacterium]MBS4001308.1 GNAT family N-acetyltransferase [Desulfobulbaceae bacterium]
MTETKLFNSEMKPSAAEKQEIVDFLFHNLDQFGDKKEDIEKAINYAIKESQSPGGFVLVNREGTEIACAVVVNETGMKGYIPENILVYIATHKNMRGKGVGKKLMTEAINTAKGNIALHVEPENPARYLYEKLGFTNKYLEMRLIK